MLIVSLLLSLAALSTPQADQPQPQAPTMGWSSWNTYRTAISDSLIMAQASAMVTTGLADAGYTYVNIDDGHFGPRTAEGFLTANPARLPDGLKPVVEHIHSLGLKAGIYSDAGRNTCGAYWDADSTGRGVGFYEHDMIDAHYYFDSLKFDFIKVDFCGGDPRQNSDSLLLDERKRYTKISKAIASTGRPVRMNICRWAYPGTWAAEVAGSWRVTPDITPAWESVRSIINRNLYRRLGPAQAVAFYNPSDSALTMQLPYSKINITNVGAMRPLSTDNNYKSDAESLTVNVPPHGCRIYIIEGQRNERRSYPAANTCLGDYQEISSAPHAFLTHDSLAPLGFRATNLGGRRDGYIEWPDIETPGGGSRRVTVATRGTGAPIVLSINDQIKATLTPDAYGVAQQRLTSLPASTLYVSTTPMPQLPMCAN